MNWDSHAHAKISDLEGKLKSLTARVEQLEKFMLLVMKAQKVTKDG